MSPRKHFEMPVQEERRIYLEGIREFNDREFFEAHEVWEDVWHVATGSKRYFYQGLIQIAVAFEHWRRGNPAGALSLYRTVFEKFEKMPPAHRRMFLGIDCDALLERFKFAFTPMVQADPAARKTIDLDDHADRLFTIELAEEPFPQSSE